MRQRQGRSGLRAGRLIGLGDGCNLAPVTKRPKIIDAKFDVVRGLPKVGERHPTRRGWYFTGQHNAIGEPLFKAWWMIAGEVAYAVITGGVALLIGAALLGGIVLVAIGWVLIALGVIPAA